MDDYRVGTDAAGYIVDNSGNTFYGDTTQFSISDSNDYIATLDLQKNAGYSSNSYVGAAEMYYQIEDAKVYINQYNFNHENTDVKVMLPVGTLAMYYCESNCGGHKITMPAGSYSDSAITPEYTVLHEYGHNVWDTALFETKTFYACKLEWSYDYEISTAAGSASKECAFQEGWAVGFSGFVNNVDPQNKFEPNGVYGATNLQYDSSTAGSRLRGEYIIANVVNILWDIYDPANEPADQIASGMSYMWPVMDGLEPVNILTFWDGFQFYYGAWAGHNLDDQLADIYLNSYIGRFSHQYYGPWIQDNQYPVVLAASSIEVLSMNVELISDSDQYHPVLFRFKLRNDGINVMFTQARGIFAGCRYDYSNSCDFGHTGKSTGLISGATANLNMKRNVNVGDKLWEFWPCYEVTYFTYPNGMCTYKWIELQKTSKSLIFSDNFEGTFGWTASDSNSGNGLDYWGSSSNQYYSGTHSAWVRGVGSVTPPIPSNYYDDKMASTMSKPNMDLRYIKVKFKFEIWTEHEICCDYTKFQLKNTDIQTWNDQASYWRLITIDDSDSLDQISDIWDFSHIDVKFYFYSDNSQEGRGTFIDDFQIVYEE